MNRVFDKEMYNNIKWTGQDRKLKYSHYWWFKVQVFQIFILDWSKCIRIKLHYDRANPDYPENILFKNILISTLLNL